ncbi:hypothetical protein ACSBLW_08940 [Thioclava sp. FR2]|uniref:hypothetical protein n=1 Tax=Thioclava sp. FR2 TaxID=3445780 RepID=UPI003EBD14EA
MSDPSIDEFYSRIAKIEKAREKGFGFEAKGTLGRSFYTRKSRRFRLRMPLMRPAFALLVTATVVKAVFLQQLGSEAYHDRVAKLQAGAGIDRLGGVLMSADPVTTALANNLGKLLRVTDSA